MKPTKIANVQGFATEILKGNPMSYKGVDLNTATVSDYQTDDQGRHYATFTYKKQIPQKNIDGTPGKPLEEEHSETIMISDPELIGRVRGLTGIPTTIEDIKGKQRNKKVTDRETVDGF